MPVSSLIIWLLFILFFTQQMSVISQQAFLRLPFKTQFSLMNTFFKYRNIAETYPTKSIRTLKEKVLNWLTWVWMGAAEKTSWGLAKFVGFKIWTKKSKIIYDDISYRFTCYLQYVTVAQILFGDFHKDDSDFVTPVHQIVTGIALTISSGVIWSSAQCHSPNHDASCGSATWRRYVLWPQSNELTRGSLQLVQHFRL